MIEVVKRALGFIDAQAGLAIQVWGRGNARSGAGSRNRSNFVELARKAQKRGELPKTADPEAVGAVLFRLMPAYALQRALTGTPDWATFLAGLTALLEPHIVKA